MLLNCFNTGIKWNRDADAGKLRYGDKRGHEAILSNEKGMITGPAAQDVTVSDRLKRSRCFMENPTPRASDRAVFSGLKNFATLRFFNFRSTFAGFFLQFDLQIGNIFFKIDDPLLRHVG